MQLLNLTYNSWGDELIRVLNTMRSTNDMCDVRLVLQDEVLPAHSCVLAAASPFFKSIFNGTENLEINLEDFPSRIVMHVLDFIYTGTSLFPNDDLEFLHSVATTLNIPGLVDLTQEMMLHSVPDKILETEPDANDVILVQPGTNVTELLSDPGDMHFVDMSNTEKTEDTFGTISVDNEEDMLDMEPQTEDGVVSVMNTEYGNNDQACVQECIPPLSNQHIVVQLEIPEEEHGAIISATHEEFAPQLGNETEHSDDAALVPVLSPVQATELADIPCMSLLESNMQCTGVAEALESSHIVVTKQEEDDKVYYKSTQHESNHGNQQTITLIIKAEDQTINTACPGMEVLHTVDEEPQNTSDGTTGRDEDQIMCEEDIVKRETMESHLTRTHRKKWLPSRIVHVTDKEVVSDGSVPDRALQTLPDGLTVNISGVDGVENSVYATLFYTKGTLFGPYEGESLEDDCCSDKLKTRYYWKIYKNGKLLHWLNGENESKANWMRYVQGTGNSSQQNLEAFQNDGKLYFRATKNIQQYSELIVKYGNPQCIVRVMDESACDVVEHKPSVDSKNALWCEYCNLLYTSELIYHRHMRHKHCKAIPLELYEMARNNRHHKKEQNQDSGDMFEEDLQYDIKESTTEISDKCSIIEQIESNTTAGSLNQHDIKSINSLKQSKRRPDMNDENKVNKRLRVGKADHKLLTCSMCDQSFSNNHQLKKHEMIHTNERPHVCATCGRAFTQKSNMVAHMKTHTDNKPCVCGHCGKGFYRQSELRKHEKFHSDETPFICGNCGKCFKEGGNFKRHMRSHTGEKPYRCPICARDFSRSENLKTHMRRHTGEKPFKCSVCGNCFSENANLQIHMRRHTGEKPFHCSVCDKTFVDICGQRAHSKTHNKRRR